LEAEAALCDASMVTWKHFAAHAEQAAGAESADCDKPPCCESPTAIRKKATVRPAARSDIGVKHENFFIAKFPDSESAQRAFRPRRRLAKR
jgi:hypothetical protein